jgi:ATP phosphoribosyltransferase
MTPTAPAAVRDRLRIAVQKSGRLGEPARALLAACGLAWAPGRDRLFCIGTTMPVDLLLVRDDDIPALLAEGACDLGIVGRNVLREYTADAPGLREWRALGFGACRLAIAIPDDWAWEGPRTLAGRRIATSYPALLAAWLAANEVAAQVVTLSGSVEIAPRLGKADAVCDLVSSGATLEANRLRAVATVLDSEAVLAGPAAPFGDARADIADQLLRRLEGVVHSRDSRLLMFQATRQALPALLALLPDADPPTVARVDGSDRVALQALCRGTMTWQRLEALKRAGADALMVLPVERSLA